MKRTIITTFTILFFSVLTFAQPPGGQGRQFDPEEMIKRQTGQMTTDLNLQEDQIPKVQKLNEKYGEKMGEIFQNNQGGDREKFREKMDSLRVAKDGELKEILTEEQFTKHQEIQEERMQRFRQMRENRPGNGTPPERRGKPRGNRQ
jgi:Spy/CpxP family protein refolding chaperone